MMVTDVQIAELTAHFKQNTIVMVGIVQSNRMPYSKAPLIQSSRADVTPMHWHSVSEAQRNPAHKDVDSNATLAIRVSLPGTLKILQPVSAEARRYRLGLTTV
jgi:hypothetical protein